MRLEITRKADLAVRAIGVLHKNDRMKGSALAERIDSTPAFVAQVMAPLVRSGWVRSDPGPTGGYEMATKVDDISMLDVIEAIEGPTVNGRCVLRGGPCPADQNCALHDAWLRARGALLDELAAIPLTAVLPAKEVA